MSTVTLASKRSCCGIHVLQLGEQPLDDVVLLHALEGDVLGVGHRGPGHRVEELLLDGGVLREGLDDAVDDVPLLGVGLVTGLLEPLEELLDVSGGRS